MKPLLVAVCSLSIGCIGPQVSDELALHPDIVAAGALVPAAGDDPALVAQLDANDGIGRVVPLVNGFAAGAPTRTWDFGPAPTFAAPLFVLAARGSDGELAPIAHNTIVEAIPGDPGYSPFWAVFFVEITDAYAGERLTSFEAIGSAVTAGLVEPPIAMAVAVNCPAVAPDVVLELGGGAAPLPPPSNFYYRGRTVTYYDLGPMPIGMDRVTVPESRRYVLRREGEEPLSEPIRNIDIVGDGDLADTNDIYERAATDAARSPLCRTVDVAVTSAMASIDTSGDDAVADLQSASQLFAPDPTAIVRAYSITDDLRNCPAQRNAGAL